MGFPYGHFINKTQTQKILEEFPWLWCIKHSWQFDVNCVRVETIERTDVVDACPADTEWWYKSHRDDRNAVVVVQFDTPHKIRLGTAIRQVQVPGWTIDALAKVDSSGLTRDLITILRPKRGESIIEYCHDL